MDLKKVKQTVRSNAGTKETWNRAKHDALTTLAASWDRKVVVKDDKGVIQDTVDFDILRFFRSIDPAITDTTMKYTDSELAALPEFARIEASVRMYATLNLMMKDGSPASDVITHGSFTNSIPIGHGWKLYKTLCTKWSKLEADPINSTSLVTELQGLSMEYGDDAGTFIATFQNILDKLANKDPPQKLPEVFSIHQLCAALPDEYEDAKNRALKGEFQTLADFADAIRKEETVLLHKQQFAAASSKTSGVGGDVGAAAGGSTSADIDALVSAEIKRRKQQSADDKKRLAGSRSSSAAPAKGKGGKGKGGKGKKGRRQSQGSRNNSNRGPSNRNNSNLQCYRCWNWGHSASTCRAPEPRPRPDDSEAQSTRDSRWCYICHDDTHDTAYCRFNQKGRSQSRRDAYGDRRMRHDDRDRGSAYAARDSHRRRDVYDFSDDDDYDASYWSTFLLLYVRRWVLHVISILCYPFRQLGASMRLHLYHYLMISLAYLRLAFVGLLGFVFCRANLFAQRRVYSYGSWMAFLWSPRFLIVLIVFIFGYYYYIILETNRLITGVARRRFLRRYEFVLLALFRLSKDYRPRNGEAASDAAFVL